MDPQDFGFLDPDPQKYSQGENINQNCRKKLFTKPKPELIKKRKIIKTKWLTKLWDKNKRKKNNKFNKSFEIDLDQDPDGFFQIKWILSTNNN